MISMVILVIWLHFLADFVLQSDYMSKNKSKSDLILLKHVCIYAVTFLVVGIPYAIVNACLHFVVDWCTSRITSHLYTEGKIHQFFVVIGFDQAIHMSCLILLLRETQLLW